MHGSKTLRLWVAVAALSTATGIAVVAQQGTDQQQTDEQEKAAAAVVEAIPQAERDRKNPVPATRESIENGKLLYSSQCAMCHGAAGAGDGVLVERLKLEMPNFSDAAHMGQRTDGELFYILTKGHGRMPGQQERFKDEVKWNLVNYVRALEAGS